AANTYAVAMWDLAAPSSRVVRSPDGVERILAARVDKSGVALAYLASGEVHVEPPGDPLHYAHIVDDSTIEAFTTQGRRRITHDLPRRYVQAIRAAAAGRGVRLAEANINPRPVNLVRATGDGRRVLTIAEPGVCEVWDTADGRLIYSTLEE